MPPAAYYAWSTPSTHGTTTYESVLYVDGTTSCSCPGWTFQRKGKPRTCRHVSKDMPTEARQAKLELSREWWNSGVRPVTRIEARTTTAPRSMVMEVPKPGRLISREE